MTVKKSKPKPKKSKGTGAKGGKPGNQNARKHGLWAQKQIATVTEGRKGDDGPARRRDYLDDVIETLYNKFNRLDDIDQLCKCANSISIAVTAANGCDRTIAIVSGKLTNLSEAIEQLLMGADPSDPGTLE